MLPYTLVVKLKALTCTRATYLCKNGSLTALIVPTIGSLYTKPLPYDFLNLYGACLQAGPRTRSLFFSHTNQIPKLFRVNLLLQIMRIVISHDFTVDRIDRIVRAHVARRRSRRGTWCLAACCLAADCGPTSGRTSFD